MPYVVTVLGTSRSGSTLLDLILGNSPDAFSCGEVHAWFRPRKKHHFKIECSCGEESCHVWDRIKNVPENRFHAFVAKELGVNYVIDSSKELCWVIDLQKWGKTNGLTVQNLLIWKDPVDLAYSYWKRGQGISVWRKSFVGYYKKFFQTGIPFTAVSYKALVENPSQLTHDICKAIGMPYASGQEKFWEKQHHYLFGSGSMKRQLDGGNSRIEAEHAFPASFMAHANEINERIGNDEEVQEVLAVLQKNDVNTVNPSNGFKPEYGVRHLHPVWYYLRKVQSGITRTFLRTLNHPIS